METHTYITFRCLCLIKFTRCKDTKSNLAQSQNLIEVGSILVYLKYKIPLKLLCVKKQMAVGWQTL